MILSPVRALAAALFFPVFATGAALAEDIVVACSFDRAGERSFTTSPLVIGLDPEGSEAAVYDPLIFSIYGEPIPASQKKNGKVIELKWVVKNYYSERSARKVNFGYTAKWNRGKGTISVRSYPHGYDNNPAVVYGTCREETPKTKGKKPGKG